jgi:hypothetical protein
VLSTSTRWRHELYEKAEITLVGGEVKVMKSILKRKITTLKSEGHHYKAQIYISVLDKIIEATREVK